MFETYNILIFPPCLTGRAIFINLCELICVAQIFFATGIIFSRITRMVTLLNKLFILRSLTDRSITVKIFIQLVSGHFYSDNE